MYSHVEFRNPTVAFLLVKESQFQRTILLSDSMLDIINSYEKDFFKGSPNIISNAEFITPIGIPHLNTYIVRRSKFL